LAASDSDQNETNIATSDSRKLKKSGVDNKTLQLTADGLTETVVLCRIDQLTSADAARQLSLMLYGAN
jgi:hypothetical protein